MISASLEKAIKTIYLAFLILIGLTILFPNQIFAISIPDGGTPFCRSIAGCVPLDAGAQCCGPGGCPELGADNPGPWSGYSWVLWQCQDTRCNTYQTKASYSCYSGDICRTGFPQGDSFLESGICNASGQTVNCSAGGTYKQCCTGTYATGSLRPEICTGQTVQDGQGVIGYCDVGSSSACGTSGGGGYIVCSGDPAYGTCKAGSQPPPPPSDICSRPTSLPPPNTVSCAGKQPCPAGDSFGLSCTKTCTDSLGQTCGVPGTSFWACQGGTQWFNDGTCWPNNPCPTFCTPIVCTPNTQTTTCGGTCKL